MKNLLIITLLFSICLITSCKKDESTTPSKPKKEILTAKPWIISEVTSLGATVYTRGGSDALGLGFEKVSLNFKLDGSITGFDNSGKMLPANAKWTLSSDETRLNIANSGVTGLDGDIPIVRLTETVLELKGKVTVQGNTFDGNLKMVPQ